mgnify:CR=1 FL=1
MVRLLVTLAAESCLYLLDNYVVRAAASSFASGVNTIKLPVADFWDVWQVLIARRSPLAECPRYRKLPLDVEQSLKLLEL